MVREESFFRKTTPEHAERLVRSGVEVPIRVLLYRRRSSGFVTGGYVSGDLMPIKFRTGGDVYILEKFLFRSGTMHINYYRSRGGRFLYEVTHNESLPIERFVRRLGRVFVFRKRIAHFFASRFRTPWIKAKSDFAI